MKLSGDLKSRILSLVGGKNVTEKKLAELLDEVEARRTVAELAPPSDRLDRPATVPDGPPPIESCSDVEEEEVTDPTAGEPEASEATVQAALLAELRQLRAKVEDLTRQTEAEDKDRAIGDGKLPVTTATPGPVGFTGSAQMPRGVPFTSPLGPRVRMKICDCPQCTPFRLFHYFCVICLSGPHHYQQRYPHFRKQWTAPGSTWGISHEVCSESCRLQYLSMIGVAPGVNDAEPPRMAMAGQAPDRPVTAMDSD